MPIGDEVIRDMERLYVEDALHAFEFDGPTRNLAPDDVGRAIVTDPNTWPGIVNAIQSVTNLGSSVVRGARVGEFLD